MNTLEFRMREFNTGGFPKGLSVMIGAMSNWIYGRDPLAPLRFEAPLAALKARLEEVMAKLENDADNEEMLTLAADLEEVIENAEK